MEADILIVDDDPGTIQVLARILTGLGKLRFATDGKTALRMARKQRPDLMLLDAEMPGMNGYLVCEIMKGDPELVDVAVMFITSYAGLKFEVAGLEMGAADFISKPVSEPLLVARVKTQLRVKRLTDQLRDVAHIDALTEISNRRRFDELLNLEWLRGLREGHPVALLLADVDHFKLFNDAYGHPAGDVCLRMVAQALSSACRRPADLVARIGGEEFAVLMPNTPLDGAEQVARRALAAVQALGIPHDASSAAALVTVSIGLAYYDNSSAAWVEPSLESSFSGATLMHNTAQDLLKAADQAMYAAKNAGRAQAWRLDVADVDTPALARSIESPRNRVVETQRQRA